MWYIDEHLLEQCRHRNSRIAELNTTWTAGGSGVWASSASGVICIVIMYFETFDLALPVHSGR